MNVHELRAAIEQLTTDAAGRRFTADERKKWNSLNEELREQEIRRERLRELVGDPRHTEQQEHVDEPRRRRSTRQVPQHLEQVRAEALTAIDRLGDTLSARAADRLEEVIEEDITGPEMGMTARYVAAVSDPDYASAFGRVLAEPQTAHLRWTPKEHDAFQRVVRVQESQRALGIGSLGGNYPVPTVLDPTIMLTSDGALNPIRQVANVRTVVGNHWTGVSSAGITASYDPEFAEVSDDTPTLAQPTADLEMARAWVEFSVETGEDWSAAQQELGKLLADARDVLESVKFLSGAGHGSHEPQGILTGGTSIITSAGTATFALADVYSLLEAVPARFRSKTVVLAHPTTFDKAYRMVGGGSTTELPVLPLREGPLLGNPKYEWSSMSSSATSNSYHMIAGDLASGFCILDRIGLSVELVPHVMGTTYHRPTGSRGLFAWWRNTSLTPIPNAFRTLKLL